MTIKEQERQALEQIKNIIANLGGADSYIGMAFDGAIEMAEQNIENDWGCSTQDLKDRVEKMDGQIDTLKLKLDAKQEHIEELKSNVEMMSVRNEDQELKIDKLYDRINDLQTKIDVLESKNDILNDDLENKDDQIIKLKAKLYDYMICEG